MKKRELRPVDGLNYFYNPTGQNWLVCWPSSEPIQKQQVVQRFATREALAEWIEATYPKGPTS